MISSPSALSRSMAIFIYMTGDRAAIGCKRGSADRQRVTLEFALQRTPGRPASRHIVGGAGLRRVDWGPAQRRRPHCKVANIEARQALGLDSAVYHCTVRHEISPLLRRLQYLGVHSRH
jgi:hypothetical protein